MLFEHDVFISYPHLSDRDDDSSHNGWVAKFNKDLKHSLSGFLGRDARIWRDNKLPYGATFGNAIGKRLAKSCTLLCVLTPAYVRRDWCLKELQEFRHAASQAGGLVIGDQSRIIAAVKTPTPRPPEGLSDSLYCEFYEVTEDRGGAPREFSQVPGGYKYEEYKERVSQIAWAIKELVERLGGNPEEDGIPTIYLAETTSDQDDCRSKLQTELEARQFAVLPSGALPMRTADEYSRAVSENLNRAFMSIHLMGSSYGLIPERGERKSIVAIQNEIAAKRSSEDKLFTRLIWVPDNMKNPEPPQADFLEGLRNSEEALSGAELIERPFENLKTRLVQKLNKAKLAPEENNLLRIYLMCDKQDACAITTVENYLFDQGFEVILPAEEGDEGQVIRYHKDNVLLCDASLILYGNTNRNFVRFCLDDLSVRAKGWGRDKPIRCKAVLRTAPETEQKKEFRTRIASVLDPPCYDDQLSRPSLEVSLRDFVDCLQSTLSNGS